MNNQELKKSWARAINKLDSIVNLVNENKELFLDGIDEDIMKIIRS